MKIKALGLGALAMSLIVATLGVSLSQEVLAFSGTGSGTASNPYMIETCEELQSIGATESTDNKLYWLYDDVDCSASSAWNAGTGFDPLDQFYGTLDGRGHSITGLTINRPLEEYVGLFESIEEGMVTSLNIVNASVEGDQYVGILAGELDHTAVRDVHAGGEVIANNYAGGLAGTISGWQDDMEIKYSSFGGSVISDNWAGGLVGHARYGFGIYNSSVDADLQADGVGGIVGHVQDSCGTRYINSVAVFGSLAGASYGGGFVGRYQDISCNTSEINDSVSYATVTGATGKGGSIGQLINATVTVNNTYFDATAAGTIDCYGIADGGSTTPACSDLGANEPPDDAPFNDADWDFENTWDNSAGLNLRTPFSFLSPPDVVAEISAIEGEYVNSLAVSWGAPDENGGEQIVRYRIEIKEEGEEWDNITDSNSEEEDMVTSFYDLKLGQTYDVRVRAQTLYSVGEWIETSYSTQEPTVIEVDTCAELQDMPNQASYLDTYVLTDDIDCADFEGFEPLEWDENDFRGVFDGQGHSIKSLHITGEDEYRFGLFKYIEEATVEDVIFEDGSVTVAEDGGSCGALAGDAESTAIYNVAVINYDIDCRENVGGIAGSYEQDDDQSLTISGLSSSGTYNAREANAGGLFGRFEVDDESVINLEQSYSDSIVTTQYAAGGLIGYADIENDDDDEDPDAILTMADTYSTGTVDAVGEAGGLVGMVEVSQIGGPEAKNSEPLQFIIDWLLENLDVAWQSELREAAQTRVPERYML